MDLSRDSIIATLFLLRGVARRPREAAWRERKSCINSFYDLFKTNINGNLKGKRFLRTRNVLEMKKELCEVRTIETPYY